MRGGRATLDNFMLKLKLKLCLRVSFRYGARLFKLTVGSEPADLAGLGPLEGNQSCIVLRYEEAVIFSLPKEGIWEEGILQEASKLAYE